jgi:hypothetical protein
MQIYSNYIYQTSEILLAQLPSMDWSFRNGLGVENDGLNVQIYTSNELTHNLSEMTTSNDSINIGGALIDKDKSDALAFAAKRNYICIHANYTGSQSVTEISEFADIPQNPQVGDLIKFTQNVEISSSHNDAINHANINNVNLIGANVYLFWNGTKWDDILLMYSSSTPSYFHKIVATISML